MSNRLVNLVHRIKGIKGPARAVLLVLADDARDHKGGRSALTTAQIAERTGFSKRTVHRAYVDLAESGHITREPGEPGAAVMTLVHPGEALSGPASVSAPAADLSAPPCQSVRGSYSIGSKNHTTSPLDHGTCGRARESAAPVLDEVDQVFAAWDAWLERCGLPGPVTRTPARRAAIAAQLGQFRVGQLLMAIQAAERGYRSGKFNRNGQGDLWFTFDKVFEVAGARGFNLLARLLDGEFGVAPVEAADPGPSAAPPVPADEGETEGEVRRLVRQLVGESAYAAWIGPARLVMDGDQLRVTAGSAFQADWIRSNLAEPLRRAASRAAGRAVGVKIEADRERITA